MAEAASASRHPGLVLGIARFYHDPRGAMRGVLESRPGEARLLAYAMLAAAILLAGRLIQGAGGGPDPLARTMEQTVSLLFFLPLAYYGLAALGTAVARACGGVGGWREGRAAFFWATLVSAPLLALSAIAAAALAGAPAGVTLAVGQIGAVFFAWALAQCFAETFGFRRAGAVLAVIVAPVLLGLGVVWALRP